MGARSGRLVPFAVFISLIRRDGHEMWDESRVEEFIVHGFEIPGGLKSSLLRLLESDISN